MSKNYIEIGNFSFKKGCYYWSQGGRGEKVIIPLMRSSDCIIVNVYCIFLDGNKVCLNVLAYPLEIGSRLSRKERKIFVKNLKKSR